jgi:hypothetical protein
MVVRIAHMLGLTPAAKKEKEKKAAAKKKAKPKAKAAPKKKAYKPY